MKRLLLLLLLMSPVALCAQTGNSADSSAIGKDTSRIWQGTFEMTESAKTGLSTLSNTLDRFQLYQPVYKYSFFNTNLSNNGTPWQDLVYRNTFSRGFDPGFHTYDIYYLRLTDTKWYDCESPFTHATYMQGPKEEANFGLIHTQNIRKQFNLGLRFQRIAAQGHYQRQALSHQSLLLHSWIRPDSMPYQALIAVEYNNGVCQENGGITPAGDTLFRQGTEGNRLLIPVNLDNARNRIFGNGFFVRQTYDLQQRADSIPRAFFRLQHSLRYQFRKFYFEDNLSNPGYYPSVFDSSLSAVNYSLRFWDNELALLRLLNGENKGAFEAKLYYRQQFVKLESSIELPENHFNLQSINQSAGGFITIKFRPEWGMRIKAEAFVSGFNAGDANIELEHWYVTKKGHRFEGGFLGFRQENNYQLQRFVSNFSAWDQQQNKQAELRLYGRLITVGRQLTVDLNVRQINGFTLMDQNGLPVQLTKAITLFTALANHRLHFGKWHLYTRLLLQQNNRNELMRLPLIQLQESFFREGKIGGKTSWRIGIDLFAVTSYRPNAYQVYSGMFYLQNERINNSLFQADFYVSAKIRRALAFIKAEHFNAGWAAYRVIPVPGYPLHDFNLKLGISWMFFD